MNQTPDTVGWNFDIMHMNFHLAWLAVRAHPGRDALQREARNALARRAAF